MSNPKEIIGRYWDAYLVAPATTGVGSIMKTAAIVPGAILVLIGITDLFGSESLLGSVFFISGIVIGCLFYMAGLLLGALGQILKASLDCAVNTSPFLGNDEPARMMSLSFVDSEVKEINPSKPGLCPKCGVSNPADTKPATVDSVFQVRLSRPPATKMRPRPRNLSRFLVSKRAHIVESQ